MILDIVIIGGWAGCIAYDQYLRYKERKCKKESLMKTPNITHQKI